MAKAKPPPLVHPQRKSAADEENQGSKMKVKIIPCGTKDIC